MVAVGFEPIVQQLQCVCQISPRRWRQLDGLSVPQQRGRIVPDVIGVGGGFWWRRGYGPSALRWSRWRCAGAAMEQGPNAKGWSWSQRLEAKATRSFSGSGRPRGALNFKPIQGGGVRSPPPLWMVLEHPRAAQIAKATDFSGSQPGGVQGVP